MLFLSTVVALTLGAHITLAVPAPRGPVRLCNGYEELCDRTWSTVSQIGSHDSAFVGTGLADNQHFTLGEQLDLGIRFLQAQVHWDLTELAMCHTSCFELNAGTLENYLETIKLWLDINPNEVLTLLLVNGDNTDLSFFAAVFESTALDSYAYVTGNYLTIDEWPTLNTLIDLGQRLIVFLDSEANTEVVPYINDEWSYFYETEYDVTSNWDFYNCDVDRPPYTTSAGRMGIVNHFLDTSTLFGTIVYPDVDAAATTNSENMINNQVGFCLRDNGAYPKAVLLDWVDQGDPFDSERFMNGLS